MAKKLTIVEQFEGIIAKCEGILSTDEIAFLESRKDLVAKKNATRTMTKEQKENEVIKADILETMEPNVSYTIGDLMKAVPSCQGLANQKVSALVRQLKEAELVTRTEVKGRAYFTKN